ncbi:hypothetical protein QBC34DRAFT_430209 [Podospora aff. communis PSN243]|uniref:Uncharacterized protein n=1 Tax=Podospora aff. communis PSN243 TaxID=3040156 RepID=A0AAV9G7E9_9PEZI|nr:hypothetical protein QBC34DRAFT_430209 [Podospora aff. communis PSN243]
MSNPVRTWSPNTGEDKIPQLYLRIPKKQQELLDHEDAWTSAKVPREVLEDLQRLIVVKPVPEVSFPAPAAEKVTMPPPEPPTQRTPRKEDPAPEPSLRGSSRSQRQNQVDAEDAGTQISWSPSPARSLRRQSPANEEPSPGPPLSITASSSPPPSYRPQHQALSKAVYLEMQTSSSVVSAEDEPPEMTGDSEEVAVPAPAAVAALAFPEPTPPSAQLIIPCTFTEGSSARPSGVQRKQLMKSVASKFSPESHRPSGLLEPAEISSNSPPWPASRVPGSSPPRPPPVDPFSSIPQTFTSASGPPLSGASGRALSKPSVETEQAQSSALYTIPPNGPVSQVPLTAFMLAYPDYRCSLSNFIRGVKVIQDVRNKKRFPVFLYDDLLRVFCGDYTDYIAALGPNEKPLTVVQWYVDNVSRPLYQKGILTKENLDSVLANHPEHDRDPSAQNPHARDFEQQSQAQAICCRIRAARDPRGRVGR